MSKLINKTTPKQFFVGDRAMLRDKRLSADAKNIYIVLRSLAESCDNVCPSYFWIANEIGYETEGKSERAAYKWIESRILELESLKFVQRISKDRGYDYEIYDYIFANPTEPTGTVTLNPQVQSPLNPQVHLERREEKEDINTLSSEAKKIAWESQIQEFKTLIKATPTYDWSAERILKSLTIPKEIQNIQELALDECASWMIQNGKSPSIFESYLEVGFKKILRNYATNTQTEITMQKKEFYDGKGKTRQVGTKETIQPKYFDPSSQKELPSVSPEQAQKNLERIAAMKSNFKTNRQNYSNPTQNQMNTNLNLALSN